MTLIPLILNFYESLDTLRQVSSSNTLETLFRRAIWVETLVSDINKQLAVRQKEYENGIINEPFYWNFWREFANHHRPDGGALKKALEDHASVTLESLHAVLTINDQPIICLGDFVSVIEKELDEMTLHLEAIRDCIINLNPEAYGDYYQKSKQKYDEASVTKAYHLWKLSVGKLTFKKLKAKQTETVANALKKGIMKYARRPTHEEILEVDEERVKHHLPEDYELPEDFKIRCAQFRTFISWEDDILHIHYNDYGRYIYSCIDKFTAEELIAIYELDMMLYLVHQDMMKLQAKGIKSTVNEQPDCNQPEPAEELFHFIHPEIEEEEAWRIHQAVKRLVVNYGMQEICKYLKELADEKKIFLPQMASVAYAELVRMGMPTSEGFGEKYFMRYYNK